VQSIVERRSKRVFWYAMWLGSQIACLLARHYWPVLLSKYTVRSIHTVFPKHIPARTQGSGPKELICVDVGAARVGSGLNPKSSTAHGRIERRGVVWMFPICSSGRGTALAWHLGLG
jgi:hypothetical protein